MATLRAKNMKPPRGYNFIEPTTRLQLTGDNLDELTRNTIAHRQYKGLTPLDYKTVELEIQRQICTRLTDSECRSEGPDDTWRSVKDNLGIPSPIAVLKFSAAAIKWFADGAALIPKPEAELRSARCNACQCNQAMTGCKCGSVFKMIAKTVPAGRQFAGLGVCSACGCSATLKVNLPRSFIRESDAGRDITYPANCWLNDPEA